MLISGYPLKLRSQIPRVFPVFSMFDRKFSLCQFTWFVTITYIKLTWQTNPFFFFNGNFLRQISKYLLSLESGDLQLQQTKFHVFSLWFGKTSKFSVLQGILLAIFPVSLCSSKSLDKVPWDRYITEYLLQHFQCQLFYQVVTKVARFNLSPVWFPEKEKKKKRKEEKKKKKKKKIPYFFSSKSEIC